MMFDKETLQTLLNIPDIAIDRMVLGERKTLKIYVHSTLDGTHCHCCDQPVDQYYGLGQEIELRHLPLGEYRVILLLRPKRYQCRSWAGRPTTTQTLPKSVLGPQRLRSSWGRSMMNQPFTFTALSRILRSSCTAKVSLSDCFYDDYMFPRNPGEPVSIIYLIVSTKMAQRFHRGQHAKAHRKA
jgi:transposase